MAYLPEMDLVKINPSIKSDFDAQFTIEPLLPGFGTTLGNTLRRVLLSSIKGAAITAVKINEATHEFTTVDGVTEDIVEIILNLKGVRIKYEGDEPVMIKLDVKGPKVVTAADFKAPADAQIINTDHVIAHINNNKSLTIEAIVEQGEGYLPTEQRKGETLPIGMIAIDAVFSPIKKIHHEVSNTRVGQKTDFDRLILDITTDGSISPSQALGTATGILDQYLTTIKNQVEPTDTTEVKEAKKTRKARAKKEEASESTV